MYVNAQFDLGEEIFSVCKRFKDFSFNYTDNTEFNIGDWETNVDRDCNFYTGIVVEYVYYTDNDFAMKQKNVDGFSIIHFMARSSKTNFENIKLYLDKLKIKFHVIAISETWLDNASELHEYTLTMFNSCWNGWRGGGFALYVTKEFEVKHLLSHSNVIDNLLESLTIEIINKAGKNVAIPCVHRTPGTDIQAINDYLENLIKSFKSRKSLYLCEHLNIDILKQESHINTKECLNLLYSYGLLR